ncbi:ABC transporter substrate-binding protein [Agrobacterium vitis]|uniref:ABC transporter substrate-binding protein n=1 Tax=Agrobacterium vitis TaxID=373 RepID=UPI003D2CF18A
MTKTNFRPSLSRRGFLGAAGAITIVSVAGMPVGIARAATKGALRFGLSAFPPSLNPLENTGTAALTVKLMLHRSLLSYDAKGSVRPELASDYKQIDPVTYEFTLRDNAVFHDGSPVEAEDVKYSYEIISAEKSTAQLRSDFRVIEAIEVTGPKSLRLKLKQPNVVFTQVLASGYAPIVSRKSTAPDYIGAGPYTLDSIDRGSAVTVKAFPDYYREGLPKSESVHFVAMPDESLRIAALESGDIDIIEYVSTQFMAQIDQGQSTHISTVDGPFMYLMFNTKEGPFTDVRLRRAVGYAIDREAINAFGFSKMGRVIDGLPVPANPAYDPALVSERFVYDPTKARALLKEAGVSNLTVELLSSSQYAQHNDTAVVMQQSLAAVGINVNLNLPDWATRVSRGNEGNYHLAVSGTSGAYNDPDAITAYIGGGQSASYTRSFGYANADIDKLLAEGRQELDPAKRAAIYAKVEELAIADVPIIPILWRPQAYGVRDAVSGFAPLPGFLSFQSALRLEETELA